MDVLLSPAELQAVLRFSLQASALSTPATFRSSRAGGPEFDLKNPAVRRLIEQIRFSKLFVFTYCVAVLGIIGLCAILQRRRKTTRWQRSRSRLQLAGLEKTQRQAWPSVQCDDGGSSSLASSSSSTLQGTRSPPIKESAYPVTDERTALLGRSDAPGVRRRLFRRLKALLMYQPAPKPAITSFTNVLPDNGTSILITLFLALNVFYLFYRIPLSLPMLFAFADRAGLCFVANLPVLYLLSAKNNQPIKRLTGWSYEGLNIFHRRLGEWMIILALLHTIGMFGVWYTLLRPAHFTLLRFLTSRVILLGLFTFVAYLFIWASSTGIVRQLYYECFLALHILVQVAALVLLFLHHHGSRPYVLAALVIWAIDRILLRMIASPVKLRAELIVAADQETVLLFCDIPIGHRIPRWLGRCRQILQGWQPGQHVFVTIPALGLEHKLQAHPFTIASPAPPTDHKGIWPLQLIIRAKDGFSKDLLNFAKSQAAAEDGVVVVLDGPYGSNDTLEALRGADRVCLIAGGSGIAVTYPYAWTLLVRDGPDALVRESVDSHARNPTAKAPPATEEGHGHSKPPIEEFLHIWVRSSWLHQQWLAFHPASTFMVYGCDENQHKDPNPIISGSASVGSLFSWKPHDVPTQELGAARPDLGLELREWVEDQMPGPQKKAAGKESTICVVVSGPDGMVRDVRNAAAALVAKGWNIEVHVEKFGW